MLPSLESPLRPQPADWPGEGAIDLLIHDAPHPSSTLEWWYLNGHATVEGGAEYSFFASFFRAAVGTDERTGRHRYAHALTWAFIDPTGKRYIAESLVDPEAPEIALQSLDQGGGPRDPVMRRAVREIVAQGQLPAPDRSMSQRARVDDTGLHLDYDGRRLAKDSQGYRLRLATEDRLNGCDLRFDVLRPVLRHGDEGYVQGNSGEHMFYYFAPRNAVAGSFTVDGRDLRVVDGACWYDHEFGVTRSVVGGQDDGGPLDVSWDWLGAQLDNGWDLSIYCLYDMANDEVLGRHAFLIDPSGGVTRFQDFTFDYGGEWTSARTFARYPVRWTVGIPGADLALQVEAVFDDQEFLTCISRQAFWEGRVSLRGQVEGREVRGRGFVERTGFDRLDTVDGLTRSIGRETLASVEKILPMHLEGDTAVNVVAGPERREYLEDVDLDELAHALVHPVRTIVDRGGKAWRSYVALACCEAVGGNPQGLLSWLAMPELVHVGSLLVDDVEDSSSTRRGGPSAHLLYGEALAINAGSLCYFLPQILVRQLDVSDADKLRIYGLYFDALRAAHCGQALDLKGCGEKLSEALSSGEGDALERHVRAVYRLKSAAPASCLGRVGAIIGGGSEGQIQGLGAYLDRLGIAFQEIDDVLNLRGFEGDLKSRGEDITEGKATMPVAKAMARLQPAGRRELGEILRAHTTDRAAIDTAIGLIEDCGALEACEQEADRLVDEGWALLDPLLAPTHVKFKLRAFGWYLLQRHY